MKRLNKKLMGIAASAIILSLIFMPIPQSSAAMSVKVLPIPKQGPERGFQFFIMRIMVPYNEVSQINSLELDIDGNSVVFDTDGNIISSHPDLSKMKMFGWLRVDTDGYAGGPIHGLFIGIIPKSELGTNPDPYTVTFNVVTDSDTFSDSDQFRIF